MTQKMVQITGLKLRSAQVVEDVPAHDKGSVVTTLDEFQDAQDIIAAVKKQDGVPAQKWLVFDLAAVQKRNAELKKIKNLMAIYADKVRKSIKKQGVEQHIHLEKRGNNFYIIGGPSVNV